MCKVVHNKDVQWITAPHYETLVCKVVHNKEVQWITAPHYETLTLKTIGAMIEKHPMCFNIRRGGALGLALVRQAPHYNLTEGSKPI